MLAPAGVLVLFLLGALSVDSAVAFLAQRRLADVAVAAANDAAGAGLDVDALRRGGPGAEEARIDPVLADRIARQVVAQADLGGVRLDPASVSVTVVGRRVTVRLAGTAEHVFASAVPGITHTTPVHASATAELRGG